MDDIFVVFKKKKEKHHKKQMVKLRKKYAKKNCGENVTKTKTKKQKLNNKKK